MGLDFAVGACASYLVNTNIGATGAGICVCVVLPKSNCCKCNKCAAYFFVIVFKITHCILRTDVVLVFIMYDRIVEYLNKLGNVFFWGGVLLLTVQR